MKTQQRSSFLKRLSLNIGLSLLVIVLMSLVYGLLDENESLAQINTPSQISPRFLSAESTKLLTQTITIPRLLSDGQFVHGPNVGDFKVQTYLREINSPLLPYADIIEERAYYYSINPRLLLTILEIQYNLVITPSITKMDRDKLYTLLDQLCQNLVTPFHERIYSQNGIKQISMKQALTLKDGTSISLSKAEVNAATYALLSALIPPLTIEQAERLVSLQGEGSFIQTYQRLFPRDDPLDESNRLNPLAVPPADMLKLPFKECSTWKLTGGPHGWSTGYDTPWSSIDFAPAGHSGCSVPTNQWVVAAASGSVEYHSSYYVRINHGNGWATDYFHLANLQVDNGHINQDQRLANPSCNGGVATGAHVHFAVVYGGLRQPMAGTSLEGWVVHNGSSAYQGHLQEGDTKVYPPNTLESDTTTPTTAISLSGNLGQNGWYNSNVQVTLTATDNASCTGVKYIKYQLNGNPEQRHNVSLVNFNVSGNGSHTLTYYAKDRAENVEKKKQASLKIDTILPVGRIVSPTEGSTVNTSQVTLNAEASDNVSGIGKVDFYVRYNNANHLICSDSNVPYTCKWNTGVVQGQWVSFTIRVSDKAGNIVSQAGGSRTVYINAVKKLYLPMITKKQLVK